MTELVLFSCAQLSLILLGGAVLLSPLVRSMSLPGRLAACFVSGSLLLTVEALIFSLLRLPWSLAGLALPLAGLSLWGVSRAIARRPDRPLEMRRSRGSLPIRLVSATVILVSLAYFGATLIRSRATSSDYLFFWGVKGVRFAEAKTFDPELLRWPFAVHLHTNYPPLFPMTLSWNVIVTGNPWWRLSLLTAFLWTAAGTALVRDLLRTRLDRAPSDVVTALWVAAMTTSMTASLSGGSAEPPLVMFETLAVLLLMLEPRDKEYPWRLLAGAALAGAALTKIEGWVSIGLIVGGSLLRDALSQRRLNLRSTLPLVAIPAFCSGLWYSYALLNEIALRDNAREMGFIRLTYVGEIARECFRNLGSGSWGLPWIISIATLMTVRRKRLQTLPALALVFGTLGFAFVYYMHSPHEPTQLVLWTLPRIAQPALSALVLAAGVACFAHARAPIEGEPLLIASESPLVKIDVTGNHVSHTEPANGSDARFAAHSLS